MSAQAQKPDPIEELRAEVQQMTLRLDQHEHYFERIDGAVSDISQTMKDLVQFMHENARIAEEQVMMEKRLRTQEKKVAYITGIGAAIVSLLVIIQIILEYS